jgi:anti-sigma factor RsiW
VNCNEVLHLLDPLIDDELAEQEKSLLMKHIKDCSTCRDEYDEINALGTQLKQLPRSIVPASLQENVIRLIETEKATSTLAQNLVNRWLKPVVTHSVAAFIGGLVLYNVLWLSGESPAPYDKIVAAHARSLMGGELTQVASNDSHTVLPWFAGKIDFAPVVPDLDEHGYTLVGGRIDQLRDRKVAALVYLRRKHHINLFVVPVASKYRTLAAEPEYGNHNGYNVVSWQDKTFRYWAVSDMSSVELAEFSALVM